MSGLQFRYDSYQDDTQAVVQTDPKNKEFMANSFIREEPYQSEFQDESTHKPLPQPSNNRERLIEQNIKLKTQIYELARQMDDIVGKDKLKKKTSPAQEEDEAVKSRRLELRRQQQEINSLKNKITAIKKQLQMVYDDKGIQAKEDELRNLHNELKALEEEKDSLLKVKATQQKAIRGMQPEQSYNEKLEELKDKLASVKQECRQLTEKLTDNQRILRKNHEELIIKKNRIKDMEAKISGSKKLKPANRITPEMIADLEAELHELQDQKEKNEELWLEKMKRIESELKDRKVEQEKKMAILRQKEKQLKVNELKIRELRKLIRHSVQDNFKRK